jgi:hypothetical protein
MSVESLQHMSQKLGISTGKIPMYVIGYWAREVKAQHSMNTGVCTTS